MFLGIHPQLPNRSKALFSRFDGLPAVLYWSVPLSPALPGKASENAHSWFKRYRWKQSAASFEIGLKIARVHEKHDFRASTFSLYTMFLPPLLSSFISFSITNILKIKSCTLNVTPYGCNAKWV